MIIRESLTPIEFFKIKKDASGNQKRGKEITAEIEGMKEAENPACQRISGGDQDQGIEQRSKHWVTPE
jgi:hypothetical protein